MALVGGNGASAPVVVGLLDSKWRVQQVSADVEILLGYKPAECTGTDVFAAVHPEDSATLMVRLGQAMERHHAERVNVRLWHKDEGWSAASVTLAPLTPEDPYPLGFIVTPAEPNSELELENRVAVLELRLHHIAGEVQAAGIGPWETPVPRSIATRARELSKRQHEILDRLASGQRVATIAKELGVSASTVRNHLSQIFRKLGVRSQAELVEALRGSTTQRDNSSTAK